MEVWFTLIVAVSIAALLKALFTHLSSSSKTKKKLPPGPLALPFIGNPIWFIKPITDIETVLKELHAKYGPIITIHLGNSPAIFIANNSLAHQALIQNGALFADRSPVPPTAKVITSDQRNISTAFYGFTWRVLRRNLTAEVLHPSRIKGYTPCRKWVLDMLLRRLEASQTKPSSDEPFPVRIIDHFRYVMFCMAIDMCFGEKMEGRKVMEIESSQRGVLLNFEKFGILNLFPMSISKIIFRKKWQEIYKLRKTQEDVLLPYIHARRKRKGVESKEKNSINNDEELSRPTPYADTLFDLEISDDDGQRKRKLDEGELVTLCSEFLDAVTDTTATMLQWVMANLVKYPEIQEKVYCEMKGVIREEDRKVIEEEDIQNMPFLKAVILETLRRHPPGHFLLPHQVSEEVVLDGGYTIPKNVAVNFMVAEIGWDPKVWKDPMEFRPERFLASGGDIELEVDITGSREIKMMPFGVGRRICPGFAMGLLHLEFFVANLIWNFKWTAADDVDLTEIRQSSVVMKYPLQSYISTRRG